METGRGVWFEEDVKFAFELVFVVPVGYPFSRSYWESFGAIYIEVIIKYGCAWDLKEWKFRKNLILRLNFAVLFPVREWVVKVDCKKGRQKE